MPHGLWHYGMLLISCLEISSRVYVMLGPLYLGMSQMWPTQTNVPCLHGTVDYYAITMGEKSDSG